MLFTIKGGLKMFERLFVSVFSIKTFRKTFKFIENVRESLLKI